MPLEQNDDWDTTMYRCTLTHIEITVSKVYEEKGTNLEHKKYITYSIPILNEEAMGDVIASEIDEEFSKLAQEYTNKLGALQMRRIKHLQDILKFGT